jgi:hypothetical protein
MSPPETRLIGYYQAHMSIPAKGLALSQSCKRVDILVEARRGQDSMMRIVKSGAREHLVQGHLVLGKMVLIRKDQVRQELAYLKLAQ